MTMLSFTTYSDDIRTRTAAASNEEFVREFAGIEMRLAWFEKSVAAPLEAFDPGYSDTVRLNVDYYRRLLLGAGGENNDERNDAIRGTYLKLTGNRFALKADPHIGPDERLNVGLHLLGIQQRLDSYTQSVMYYVTETLHDTLADLSTRTRGFTDLGQGAHLTTEGNNLRGLYETVQSMKAEFELGGKTPDAARKTADRYFNMFIFGDLYGGPEKFARIADLKRQIRPGMFATAMAAARTRWGRSREATVR